MRLEDAIWLFPAALTLHNLEEAIWLPAWSRHAGFWYRPVGPGEFRIAVGLLAVAAFMITYWSRGAGVASVGGYVLAGFIFAMLLNVIYHVGATVALREYTPGVASAVLINLPVMSYLLLRMFRQQWLTWPSALIALVLVPLAIVLSIPGLLWIGQAVSAAFGVRESG